MTARNRLDGLILVGVNHRSASLALREKLYLEEEEQAAFLGGLSAAGIGRALLLSTCDRVEILAEDEAPARAAQLSAELLAVRAGLSADDLLSEGYALTGREALRHLYAVAAALDSQVIGEPQVLGQVKAAHRLAAAAGTTSSFLEAVLQGAYQAAKRVRSETALAEQPVSLAAAALTVARKLHGRLESCRALLCGLGEMGELMAWELRDGGVQTLDLWCAGSSRGKAVAHRLRAHLRAESELTAALAAADIVVAAEGRGGYLLQPDLVERALKARRRKPIFLIDVAVPGDVDPAVEALDGAYRYTLDDLERIAAEGRSSREKVRAAAWKIIGEELAAFERDQAERTAVPLLVGLRAHFDALRAGVLDEGLDAEEATRRLNNRLLHEPSEALRRAAAEDPEQRAELARALRRLFPSAEFDGGGEET